MNAPNTSIEKQSLARLASAIADCLEMPTLPDSLKDSLNEIGATLIDELSPSIAFQLRALALAYPEPESTLTGQLNAKASA